ncbi:Rlp7p Ecym_1295 [Eremothecium cymbalariae DBVPG|uniref:Ribosome biogenesis protein RLP7 n=1 Tax=Eremothecium cymbalariae (strain CBS 270.75 / DBVPG 7215 / KCTC 17166 / NRRL Y-17582) TaxID=931890 RepID=G8JN69_ERECY|nr:hypothetical protein Ecym_1295 [Eremothecium cymbalariae DBVPG\
MSTQLNSNPEILLRKRRNADRTRLEKQELAKKKKELADKQRRQKKGKFVRAEAIVSTSIATEREKERIKRVSKLEHKKVRADVSHVASTKDFILHVTESAEEEGEDGLVREKVEYFGEEILLFIIRVKGPTAVNIPQKAFKVLSILRLVELNTGVFIKLTKEVFPLLKIIAPYVVIGRPSLKSIRSLIQKRSRILYQKPDEEQPTEIVLNDNNIVEEKLGNEGILCVEDIIHEVATMGEAFSKCNHFLLPFKLNREVSGFTAMSKLQKLKQREIDSKKHRLSNAATAPIIQVDIDVMIEKLN